MKNNAFIKIASIVVASSLLLFVTHCGTDLGSDDESVPVLITFSIPSVKEKAGKVLSAPSPSIVNSIAISISAADMTTISDTFNVSAGTTVTRSYSVPPGTERTFSAYAYDGTSGTGFLFYQGTSIDDLTAGVSTTVVIPMGHLGQFVDVNSGDDAIGDGSPVNPYRTISKGLAASAVNEPINVAAGIYNFSTGETFPLQLQPGTKLNCYGASHTTVIDRDDVYSPAIQGEAGASIDGCKIVNAGPAVDDAGSQITVTNNWIENHCPGVIISANSTVSNNTIQFADQTGECSQDGIVISAPAAVTPVISNNKVTNSYNAIYLSQNANPTISGNTITDNSTGIYLWSNSMPTITGNTIRANNVGVNVASTSRAWINNNVLSCNTGIDLATFSNYSIDATSNQWDNTPPFVEFSTCPYSGEDICNNGIGSVDYTGFSLAPSPCPTPVF